MCVMMESHDGTNIFKVSVLVNGELLLDGHPVTLAQLEQAMEQSAKANANAVVWYYRQNAADEPPPVAMDAIKLITSSNLSIRLSSKPNAVQLRY